MYISLSLIMVLLLAAPAMAQDSKSILVWYTIDDIGPVINRVSADFQAATGVTVTVQYVRPQQLYDSIAKTGGGPDVILTSSDDVGPLIDNNLVASSSAVPDFFLSDVLDALPALIEAACPEPGVAECLWPRTSPTLNVGQPDERLITRTESWLCSSADWMPMCPKGDRAGVPLGWWFNIYLISDAWLAENGFVVPADVTGIDELRSEYGLDYVWADEGSLPLAEQADSSAVTIFPSTLVVEDPQGLMRSMGSFDQAGYLPVLELGIDSLFISAGSVNPALAQDYVDFVAGRADVKAALMDEASLLPAVDVNALQASGLNTPESLAMLRAVVTLTAYSQLVY